MRIPKQIHLVLLFVFALVLVAPGCALRNQSSRRASPVAPRNASSASRCPDRVERAKVGGFVGTVFGTVAASLIGSPFIGGLYQVAGYVMGFASGDACQKRDSLLETNGSPKRSHPSTSAKVGEKGL